MNQSQHLRLLGRGLAWHIDGYKEEGMFRFHRKAHVSRGKLLEAMQWAKEVTIYINQKYAPVSVQVYSELFGDLGMIHWYADYEDLATIEKFNNQLLADQGYWALLNKSQDWFIEGSVQDTLSQSF